MKNKLVRGYLGVLVVLLLLLSIGCISLSPMQNEIDKEKNNIFMGCIQQFDNKPNKPRIVWYKGADVWQYCQALAKYKTKELKKFI